MRNSVLFLIVIYLFILIIIHCDATGPGLGQPSDPVIDIDGNVYETVKIGDQIWMAENLKVKHYRNGEPIPNVTELMEWMNLLTGAYCAYNNIESNADTYGYLYNWYAVDDSQNIAPEGWHVPTEEEWETLVDYLGGYEVAGSKMKEAGTSHWKSPNTGATNVSGFSALPAGFLRPQYTQNFDNIGEYAYFWSSTETSNGYYSYNLTLSHSYTEAHLDPDDKQYGYSVRCIKD